MSLACMPSRVPDPLPKLCTIAEYRFARGQLILSLVCTLELIVYYFKMGWAESKFSRLAEEKCAKKVGEDTNERK